MNKYWIRLITIICLVAVVGLSCRFTSNENSTEINGRIVFEDDFSDPESGWNRASAESGEVDYADGMYRIFVNQANLDIWAMSDLDFTDVSIEVQTLKVGGDRNNRFGVICRAIDENNFYTFIISSDGFFGIGKIRGAQYQLIEMQSLQPSDAILAGSAINHIRADCIGDTLTFYVNDQQLIQVRDAEFSSGDVGLIAGTYDSSGTDIRFDNFVVREP